MEQNGVALKPVDIDLTKYSPAEHKCGAAWKHQKKYGYLRKRITGGLGHTVAILADGSVIGCGRKDYLQLEGIEQWTDVVELVCGHTMTVGLKSDGSVPYFTGCFLPIGAKMPESEEEVHRLIAGSVPPHWSEKVISISCTNNSEFHVVGLREDGRVYAFGYDIHYGQCDVDGWCDISQAVAYNNMTIGVRKDGTVVVCGKCDDAEEIEHWTNIEKVFIGQIGSTVVGLKYDGTVVCSRKEYDVSDWCGIIQVAVSSDFILGIDGDGKLYFAGHVPQILRTTQYEPILDISSDGLGNIIAIAENKFYACNISEGGQRSTDSKLLIATGGLFHDLIVLSGGQVLAVAPDEISCGQDATEDWCLFQNVDGSRAETILDDGSWNYDSGIFPSVNTGSAPIRTVSHKRGDAWEHQQKYGYLRKRIAGGIAHTVSIQADGRARACGKNGQMQIQDVDKWTDLVEIVCGQVCTCGLRSDGKIYQTGYFWPMKEEMKTDPESLRIFQSKVCGTPTKKWAEKVVSISCSFHEKPHWVGLTESGRVYATGFDCQYGQCNVDDWYDIKEVKAVMNTTIGVKKDGSIVVCGNLKGIETIASWTNIEHIYTDLRMSLVVGLKYDGTVVCSNEEYTSVSSWKNIIYISCENEYVAGLDSSGRVHAAGKIEPSLLKSIEEIEGALDIHIDVGDRLSITQKSGNVMFYLSDGEITQTPLSLLVEVNGLFQTISV